MKSKIISVVNGKGGVGKSTVALNLAIDLHRAGYKVALFDTEKKGTTCHVAERGELDVYRAYDRMISQNLLAHKPNYDFLIVDTAGANSDSSQSADNLQELINTKVIAISDLAVIPLIPSPVDVRKTIGFLEDIEPLVDAARGALKTQIVLNRYKVNEKLSIETIAYLKETYSNHPYHSFDNVTIRQTTTVTQADGYYQSVNEYAPRSDVAIDFRNLVKTVLKEVLGE
jgi:chromosome partitioning protein